MFFYERVNRITSRDYNSIFVTDFESLVRYDWFGSDFFENQPLVWRRREFVYSNIFGLYIFFDQLFKIFFLGSFSILRQYSLVKIDDYAKIEGRGKVCVLNCWPEQRIKAF